ncbi:Mitochondrial substrate carrier family protein [Zea mays]|uniref:Mitochondrial substrate carrier family protein n=1 Tax=Zea mays TaxID=4577 RepID=A0A1D6IWP9_MAIZE|nr:Mitochondrial substrate carrier family protein [Zea mays]
MIKTRNYSWYSSDICFHSLGLQVVVTEGVKSLYKGGFATFARVGPQTTITFVVCEKLRELAGMTAI